MIRLLKGDCRAVLPDLDAASVQCVVTSPPYYGLRSYLPDGHPDKAFEIGLESSIPEYIANIVDVFRHVRRVLRDDGTMWVNLGDSYATGTRAPRQSTTTEGARVPASWANRSQPERIGTPVGYKTKDLLMMPARVALALQEDGWILRRDIIWSKPNPMPESVEDRPTTAHEFVFLLAKSPTYFYDAEAIAEEGVIPAGTRAAKGGNVRSKLKGVNGRPPEYWDYDGRRSARSVWTIPTRSYPGAHFATMPPELARRCIAAATSLIGRCPVCGQPWHRLVAKKYANPGNRTTNGPRSIERRHATAGFPVRLEKRIETIGWARDCACPHRAPVPCVVLDPFAGVATTGLAADRMGRDAVLIDLSADYRTMARARIVGDLPLFADVAD